MAADGKLDEAQGTGTPFATGDLDETLRKLGYEAFRPGQREAVETLLERGRLLLVAPTGGGKSLIYQLPACLLPGTTLVISPLIALMADQVAALRKRGVRATYLASTLDPDELRRRQDEVAAGEHDLVYVAPERLTHAGFRAVLASLDCPLVAVDEAHCISEWGHDFRPEYGQIGELLAGLGSARVLACTATATPVVRDEILEKLDLPADTPQLVRGFARPNLALSVLELDGKRHREHAVDTALRDALGRPGEGRGAAIIYSPTRRITEQEAERLAAGGWAADAYHAGLDGSVRDSVQRSFTEGELEVVVATNAFGMGIDRADVRLVVHLAPPGSVEAYYQEVGRAGRDDAPADGLLVLGPGDLGLRRSLLERDAERSNLDPESAAAHLAHKWNLFLELMRWAEGGSCRHDAILRYFGDEEETLSGCGRCDVCRRLEEAGDQDDDEAALVVRKALSGVARVHGRYGLSAAARLLKGLPDDRLARAGLDAVSTFGILAMREEEWIARLLRRCVTAGWVDFRGGDRPVVVLTAEGEDVMRERRPARLLLPPAKRPAPVAPAGGRGRGRKRRASAAPAEALDAADREIFDALRAWRLATAKAMGKPPYVVASDRTLRDVARQRPDSRDALYQVHGLGPSKVARYGDALLAVVRGETPDVEDDEPDEAPPDSDGDGDGAPKDADREHYEPFDEGDGAHWAE